MTPVTRTQSAPATRPTRPTLSAPPMSPASPAPPAPPAPPTQRARAAQAAPPPERTYTRFGVVQRVEHLVLIASFTVLAVTGLPQKIQPSGVSDAMIAFLGGIEMTRRIHHEAAVVLVALSLYHLVELAYHVFVAGTPFTMLPGAQDARDLWNSILYSLGKRRRPPAFGRYSYAEKAEYWALVWGTVIMALTGLMLWNPIATTKWVPGDFIPAAKAAHGGEAILAVLSILLWHFYNVHLKHLNLSMFTGRLREREMAEEHPAELALLRAGGPAPRLSEAALARRTMVFVPAATLALGGMFIGLVLATSTEETAVASPPAPEERALAFAPVAPTPNPQRLLAAAPVAQASELPGAAAAAPADAVPPATRIIFQNDVLPILQTRCVECHAAPGEAATDAAAARPALPAAPPPAAAPAPALGKPIPHSTAGQEECLLCHSAGPLAVPASHAGRTQTTCQDCHTPS